MSSKTIIAPKSFTLPQSVAARPAAGARLLYLDNLRILLTALVILLHLSIGYGAEGDWYYNEEGPATMLSLVLLSTFTIINQAFFMGFFFMIASYLTPASYERKGAALYVHERLKRLGIPILFYALVVQPLLVYLMRVYYGDTRPFWQSAEFGPGPMWFIEALLIFSLGYVAWRLVTNSAPTTARPGVTERATAPTNVAIALFAIVLGLVAFIVRTAFPVGWWFEPLHLQLAHFPQYIALFGAGIFAYRRGWFDGLTDRQGKLWGWIAAGLAPLFVAIAIAAGALDSGVEVFLGGWGWQSLVYCIWEQFMCVAMIVALLVLFRNRFNYQSQLARTLSGDAYAVYVVHAPVIVLLALALSGIPLEMGLKFLLVAPVAVGLSFLAGHYVRKLPLARNIL